MNKLTTSFVNKHSTKRNEPMFKLEHVTLVLWRVSIRCLSFGIRYISFMIILYLISNDMHFTTNSEIIILNPYSLTTTKKYKIHVRREEHVPKSKKKRRIMLPNQLQSHLNYENAYSQCSLQVCNYSLPYE